MHWLYLFGGLAGLLAGSELAVKGALGLARRLHWPEWLTGILFLATGTSLPELFVSGAAAPAHPTLAVGNVTGSNAFNTGMVLGLMMLVSRGRVPFAGIGRLPATLLLLGCLAAFPFFGTPEIPPLGGVVLLAAFALSVGASLRSGHGSNRPGEADPPHVVGQLHPALQTLLMLGGFALLALASDAFLRGALGVAAGFGWSEGLAGYLIAAVGTSAPELFTSLRAARHGAGGAVVGNVFGSNSFNLLVVGGVVALRARTELDAAYLLPGLVVNLGACAVVALPALVGRLGRRVPAGGRLTGALLVLGYFLAAWRLAGS